MRIQNYINKQDWLNVSKELKPLLEQQGTEASVDWVIIWRQAEIAQQNWKEALATWDLQRKVDPESVGTPEALIQQGSLKEQIGDNSGALVSIEKSLKTPLIKLWKIRLWAVSPQFYNNKGIMQNL